MEARSTISTLITLYEFGYVIWFLKYMFGILVLTDYILFRFFDLGLYRVCRALRDARINWYTEYYIVLKL